ncbi:transglutaminase [Methanobacterium sp. CWC-01]|uniref:Ig-like domain-containing protein n=1 Tax=Methanobacterium aridiramus TaxID=2584467 RepID=UPI002575E053|nr:Ig-like domain-containing protein [Methanobacterium sp. CWC-01]WJI10400.1 transglutaminase [Methanobacterium sp. CWC-01]
MLLLNSGVCFASANLDNTTTAINSSDYINDTSNSTEYTNSYLNNMEDADNLTAPEEVENISEGAAGSLSEQYINANGIWIRSDDISLINGTALKNAGITDVFVKVSRVVAYQTTLNQLTQVKQLLLGTGIRVHAWVTCFLDANGNWVDPQNTTVQDEVLDFTSKLASSNLVDGVHLDYVRYPGTAYLHSGGTEAITQFVARVNTAVKTANSLVALSAALMPEGSVNAYYYGQDYSQLASYLDFLVPMIYKGNYGEDTDWIGDMTSYIVSQTNGTPVLVGLQTYISDSNLSTLSAAELGWDINEAAGNGASGYVLFRYGLIDSSYLAGGDFDAAPDSTAPIVSTVDPVNNAVNVAIDKVITVTYNEAIKTGTMWIELLTSSGASVPVTCAVSGNILTITPKTSLTSGIKYTLAIHTGAVKDLTGNQAAAKVTTFTTAQDKTAPVVKTVDPANNAVNVAVNKAITITYSETIKAGTMWIELLTSTGTNVPVTIAISGNKLTITPTSNLDNGIKYTLAIHTGAVKDLTGNQAAAKVSTFTTLTDTTAPTIITIDPTNNAVNVANDKKIIVTFNEPIKEGTMWIELLTSTGTNVPVTCAVSGTTLTITPTNNLNQGTKHTLAIHTGAITDLTGNLVKLCGSTFTTITTDNTPPTITTIDPTNNAVNIVSDQVITVTYNEAIKTGTMWIELLTSTGANVPVTCAVSGTTLTITPNSNLDNGTKHTLAIHTGAVTDLNGNQAAAKVTTFTTEGASGSPTTTFAFNDVIDAAGRVKDFIAVNHRMPTYVEISSVQVSMPQLLYLFTTATVQANSKDTSPITLLTVSDSTNPTESTTIGTIYQAEILDIANRVKSYIGSNYRLPNYTTTSRGQAGSESLIDLYSRVLVFYDSNQRLPTYATITPWLIEDYNSPASNLAYSADLQQYLPATTNCQSNDSRIIALAQSITADCTTTYEMGLAIYNWVRDYMDYSFYYNSQKGAVDSMLNGSANCCDLSHLIVALSRAVNLPARYKHGTCTFSSGTYGHVWAEIYVNGKWVTADASSNANSFGTITNWNTSTYILKGTYSTLPF